MKPVSNEVRKIIIKHWQNGKKAKEIAHLVFRGVATVYRIISLFVKNKNVEPKPYKGNHRKITAVQEEKILEKYEKKPDGTLLETIDELRLEVSESGLSRWLARHKLTLKKRRSIRMVKNAKML
jgi:transposase